MSQLLHLQLPAASDISACSMPAGWFALWHTTMKDIGFFREIMGTQASASWMLSSADGKDSSIAPCNRVLRDTHKPVLQGGKQVAWVGPSDVCEYRTLTCRPKPEAQGSEQASHHAYEKVKVCH